MEIKFIQVRNVHHVFEDNFHVLSILFNNAWLLSNLGALHGLAVGSFDWNVDFVTVEHICVVVGHVNI